MFCRWLAIFLSIVSVGFAKTVPQAGAFAISAEWLYMLNSIDQPYFAQEINITPDFPNGNRFANTQTWNSGYRVDLYYGLCDADYLTLRWTHFPTFSNRRVLQSDTQNLQSTLEFPGFDNNSNYQSIRAEYCFFALDFLYTHDLYCSCPYAFSIVAGLQAMHLHFKEEATGSSLIENRSKRYGIGPELGLDMGYALGCGISLQGRASGALLVAHKKAKFHDENGGAIALAQDEGYFYVLPALNARIGANYDWCLPCALISLELGYEIITYLNGLDRVYFVDDADPAASFNQYMNFSLHGPYLQLGVTF